MRRETLYCGNESFLDHYLPCVSSDALETVLKGLEEQGLLKFSEPSQSPKVASLFSFTKLVQPSAAKKANKKVVEATAFLPVTDLVTGIQKSLEGTGHARNSCQMWDTPNKEFTSDTPGCNFTIDACLTEARPPVGAVSLVGVVVPIEYKTSTADKIEVCSCFSNHDTLLTNLAESSANSRSCESHNERRRSSQSSVRRMYRFESRCLHNAHLFHGVAHH